MSQDDPPPPPFTTVPTKKIITTSKLPNPSSASSSSALNPTGTKPWHAHLTLDLIMRVLSRSIFHPAIVLIFYLCLAAVHKHRTALAAGTLYYAAFLALIEMVLFANRKLTYGFWARKVEWDKEVVVITGGGGGLGLMLAQILMLSKTGVKVAVLDLREAGREEREWIDAGEQGGIGWKRSGGGFWWGKCDVSDLEDVRRNVARIEKELGSPTILINNAATPVNALPLIPTSPSIKTITAAQAAHTFKINTLSHFNTLSVFLPYLLKTPNGGTIVTISSILANLSPSLLSDYSASKAALSSLHSTLTHEIATHPDQNVRRNLKTVLVEPGQINTKLFADITSVPWYANFFGPVLDPRDVAREIVSTLETGESAVLRMPFYCRCMGVYASLPGSLQWAVRRFARIDKAIVGRGGKKAQ